VLFEVLLNHLWLPADFPTRLRQKPHDSTANAVVIVRYKNEHDRLARNCAEPIR